MEKLNYIQEMFVRRLDLLIISRLGKVLQIFGCFVGWLLVAEGSYGDRETN